MTPWIINYSRYDIAKGMHRDPGHDGILIQISDPPGDHPIPKFKFDEVYQFDFLDIDEDGVVDFGDGKRVDFGEFAITQDQADSLVSILKSALERKRNVIVHCHMGICRSGAVTEIGTMMGFNDLETHRQPNVLVKHKMMKSLRWTYE